jgi:hypothetical protein
MGGMDFHEYGEDMGFDNDDDGHDWVESKRPPDEPAPNRDFFRELSAEEQWQQAREDGAEIMRLVDPD